MMRVNDSKTLWGEVSAIHEPKSEAAKRALTGRVYESEHLPKSSVPAAVVEPQVVNWRELGECPIAGYELTDAGLYDKAGERALENWELSLMINQMAGIEGKTKNQTDRRFSRTITNVAFDGGVAFGPVMLPSLFIYFWVWKLPRAYDSAWPQKSLLVRHYYQPRVSARRLERLCQRRQVLFNFTNPRPLLHFTGGLTCIAFGVADAFYLRKEAATDKETREVVRYHRHVEGVMKWLYTVHFHHPTYAPHNQAKEKPLLTPPERSRPGTLVNANMERM